MQTKKEILSAMTTDQLLEIFFSNGGRIHHNEFLVPCDEKNEAFIAYEILHEISPDRRALHNLQKKYNKGEADEFGKEHASR